MKVDHTSIQSLQNYRERLLRALENADYLSPVAAYQKALLRTQQEIRALQSQEKSS